MKTVTIQLNTINDVKNFVAIVSKYPFDVVLHSGRFAIDAKSIMGLFSLDLSHPVKVEVHGSDADRSAFEQSVAAFEVKQTQ